MPEAGLPSRSAIEAEQLVKLRALLVELEPRNSFYGPRLRSAGLTPPQTNLEVFQARMPFTLKHELAADQRTYPPYGTNLTFPLERYTRFHQTSATTGVPMRWLDTPESWEAMLDNWIRVYQAAGVKGSDRIFFAFSFGPFLGFWTAFEAGARLGCLCLPGGGLSSLARLQVILDNRATVLCLTPTYAIRLAEAAAEEKVDLTGTSVRTLIVAGEPGGSLPQMRRRIVQLWHGARVVDHHGMTETGPVSYECPARPGVLHVMEMSYLAEVIDPASGQPASSGSTGELVLTTLTRTGSPVLRYRTGDLVKPAPPSTCACGSSELALEGGILGRSDDMVIIRGGNLHPSAVEEVVWSVDGVAEYRVEVRTNRALAELNLKVEARPGVVGKASLARRLESALRAAFNLRIPVTLVPRGTLPRFELKAKRWVRLPEDGPPLIRRKKKKTKGRKRKQSR